MWCPSQKQEMLAAVRRHHCVLSEMLPLRLPDLSCALMFVPSILVSLLCHTCISMLWTNVKHVRICILLATLLAWDHSLKLTRKLHLSIKVL